MTRQIPLNIEEFIEDFLFPYLRIRSISARDETNPEENHKRDQGIKDAYSHLEKEFIRLGFNVTGHDYEAGNRVLFAQKIVDENLPTVLIYGHYDVQPITEPKKWITKYPFEPEIHDGKIICRGADDNKGQFSAYILAMRYFAEHGSPCNIKFVIEGDEESHGKVIHTFVKDNAEMLACDTVLLSDTSTLIDNSPAITTQTKGYLFAHVTTKTIDELVDIIHNSHDPATNRVLIPGFYDEVLEQRVSTEIKQILNSSDDTLGVVKKMGECIKPEEGYTPLDHRWYRPTNTPLFFNYANQTPKQEDGNVSLKITVHGPSDSIHSGQFGGPVQDPTLNLTHLLAYLKQNGLTHTIDYVNYGSRDLSTAIQPKAEAQITFYRQDNLIQLATDIFQNNSLEQQLFSLEIVRDRNSYLNKFGQESYTASAILSFRMVRDQNPDKIFDSLQQYNNNITLISTSRSFYTDTSSQYVQAVVEGFKEGFEKEEVVFIGEGGSIPVTATFKDTLKVPVILAGLGSPDGNLHGPNENFPIEHLERGTRSIIYSLQNIGKISR